MITPIFFAQAEIDPSKVAEITAARAAGIPMPPVVAVRYGSSYLPLDGHHRMSADHALGRQTDAWIVEGPAFERLDRYARDLDPAQRAEDLVMCAGVPAMQVAALSGDC